MKHRAVIRGSVRGQTVFLMVTLKNCVLMVTANSKSASRLQNISAAVNSHY